MQNHTSAASAYIRPGTPGDVVNLCIGGRLFITRRATLYRLPDSRLYMIATQGEEAARAASQKHEYRSQLSSDSQYTGEYTVGGATLLPNPVASSLFGNKDLISAAAVCKNQLYNTSPTESHSTRTMDNNHSYPGTLLQDKASVAPQPVYFFDRDPEIFRFVLDYYRTGELHLPTNICGPFVRKELIFWGIDESLIDPCCMPAYMRYDEEKRTKKTLFRDCFEDIDSMQNLVKFSRGWKKWRYRMWLFMDHPTSSFAAQIWASFLLILMIASILCFCFSTSSIFRRSAWAAKNFQAKYSGLLNISNLLDDPLEICDDSSRITNSKVQKDCFTEPASGLVILDMALNVVLTTEFLLKVLLAPDKHKFLTSIVSIIDMVNLFTYWIYISVFYFTYYHKKQSAASFDPTKMMDRPPNNLWLLNILSMTQIMRILRIFKVSKISRGLRVLMLTVKKSIPELMLLAFLLMNGMFMFSCMIYMAEYSVNDTFADIPEAFWWSIITLTTVGYGDTYPKGTAGYIVGSMAAISGCIVTGLAIPIIGNNFNTYYMYMKNQLKEDKYLKELRRDINSVGGNNIMKGLGGFAEKTGIPMLHRKYRQFRGDKQYPVSNRIANTTAAKREEGHRKTKPMLSPTRKKNFPFSETSDNLKMSLLMSSGSRSAGGEPSNLGDNTRTTTLERVSLGDSADHRQSIGMHSDPIADRRTSMLHPLATDGLLNLIPSSEIHTSGSLIRPEWEEPSEMELEEIRCIHAALRNRGPNNADRESFSSDIDPHPSGMSFSGFTASLNEQHNDSSFYATADFCKLSPLADNTGLKRNYV